MSFPGEKVFHGEKQIKYVFQSSKTDSKYLVVVFSGFAPVGNPAAYNYFRTLNEKDYNKLFILDDYGTRGCYYLGENKDFSVENSVYELISTIAKENRIENENIITCGSSKGGYAALYYGIKYQFGYIISGAPQTYLGSYLIDQAPASEVAEYIAGGKDQKDKEFLNNLLFDVLHNYSPKTNIFIHVGKGDHHYKNHIIPFINELLQRKIPYSLDIGSYQTHGEISMHYPNILLSELEKIHQFPVNSINPNKDIFESIKGKTIIHMEYSNERDAADYVILHFTDGTSVKLTSNAQVNDITWIRAERA